MTNKIVTVLDSDKVCHRFRQWQKIILSQFRTVTKFVSVMDSDKKCTIPNWPNCHTYFRVICHYPKPWQNLSRLRIVTTKIVTVLESDKVCHSFKQWQKIILSRFRTVTKFVSVMDSDKKCAIPNWPNCHTNFRVICQCPKQWQILSQFLTVTNKIVTVLDSDKICQCYGQW